MASSAALAGVGKEERTACVNRIRGLLAEFGVVVAQSPKALRECLGELVEDGSNELCVLARLVIERARQHLRELDEHIAWCVSASSSALEAAIAATK